MFIVGTTFCTVGREVIVAKQCIKYLGLNIDSKLKFTIHAKQTAVKANKVVQKISHILPNIILGNPKKRKLIGNVATSILLYGAPNWANSMSKTGIKEHHKVTRKTNLRVISAYSTTSADAAQVLSDTPPIDLMATERKDMYLLKATVGTVETRREIKEKTM
uniref:Uncharacterized protein n=1 Tax=Sipha flava TaxID=143950 RepID=A0A2S2R446_9HEMI